MLRLLLSHYKALGPLIQDCCFSLTSSKVFDLFLIIFLMLLPLKNSLMRKVINHEASLKQLDVPFQTLF